MSDTKLRRTISSADFRPRSGHPTRGSRTYLKSLGVDEARLHVVSYGEENPLASGGSAGALAKNRRVDFRLYKGNIEFVLEEGEPVDDEGNPIK